MSSPQSKLVLYMFVALASLTVCNSCGIVQDQPSVVSSWVQTLEQGNIRRIELVYLPEEILVRAALSPQTLQADATYRVTITEPSPEFTREVAGALRSENFTAREISGDFRLGALFYSEPKSQVPILSIFFDQSGSICVVNGSSYVAKGSLRAVLRDRLRGLMR